MVRVNDNSHEPPIIFGNGDTCEVQSFIDSTIREGDIYYKQDKLEELTQFLDILLLVSKEDLKPLINVIKDKIQSTIDSEKIKVMKYNFDKMPFSYLSSNRFFHNCNGEIVKIVNSLESKNK